jgi:hypothetical protein
MAACSSNDSSTPAVAGDASSGQGGGGDGWIGGALDGGSAPESSSGTIPQNGDGAVTASDASTSADDGTAADQTGAGTSGDASTGGGDGAGVGEGGSVGCPAAAVFCDGFEGSTTLGASWMPDPGNPAANSIAVVSTLSHTGTNALKMSFGAQSDATFLDTTKGFPISSDQWGRVWLNVNTPNDAANSVYIEGSNGMNVFGNGVRPLNTRGGSIVTNVYPSDGAGAEKDGNTGMALPKGVWTCFEWHIAATGANGSLDLYMNGAALPNAAITFKSSGNATVTGLLRLRIGYHNYNGAATASTIYVDDFAIGNTTQLGCQ